MTNHILDYTKTRITDTDLEHLTLLRGWHASREDGLCVLEAVAWFAGLAHSDQPECTDPVVAAYARALNDALPDEQRARLIPYIPRLAGTADGRPPEKRALIAVDRAVRVLAPLALRAAGLTDEAVKLESLPVIDSADRAARAAWAARAAARAAASAAREAREAASAAAKAAWATSATSATWAAREAASAAAWAASAAAKAAWATSATSATWAARAAAKAAASAAYDEAFELLDDLIESSVISEKEVAS